MLDTVRSSPTNEKRKNDSLILSAPFGGRWCTALNLLQELADMTEKTVCAPKNVWMVTREYEGIAGAGGVKDVCRQLAETLVQDAHCSVSVVLPRYGFIDAAGLGFRLAAIGDRSGRIGARRYTPLFEVDMNYSGEERREPVAVWQGELGGVRLY